MANDEIAKQLASNIRELEPAALDDITTDETFQSLTQDLMEGSISVPEYIDRVVEIVNEKVDVPYVPEAIEAELFEIGFNLLAKMLHGMLEPRDA